MQIEKLFILNNISLQKKLLSSYIFLVLIPTIAISFFLVSKIMDTTFSYTENIYQINFSQMKTNITNLLYNYTKLSDGILAEKELMQYIETHHNEDEDYFYKFLAYKNIYDTYSIRFPITYGNLVKFTLYTTNNTIINDSQFFININRNTREEQWYREVHNAHGQSIFLNSFTEEGINYISIGKLLNSFNTGEYTNILLLRIPESEIYKLIEKEGANKSIYILDKNNNIISSTDRSHIGANIKSIPSISKLIPTSLTNQHTTLDTDNSIVIYDTVNELGAIKGWKIVSIASRNSMLYNITNILKSSILLCLFNVAITIIFVLYLTNTLTKRLKMLVTNMSKIKDGKFDVFIKFEGKDEISELNESFKDMVERINTLIKEVYILDIEKKDAEIKALQSQINPHFLFNTMESIRMNLWSKQDYETSEIIQSFAKLLRKSIDWGSEKITLRQELDLAETYLKIQKYRYTDKFDYEINVSDTLYKTIIPKFTLQPIVENAIYHGLELKRGKGLLMIFSEFIDEDFKIIVQDDGIGIDEDRLAALKEQINTKGLVSSKSRIGIRNIHQRIQLSFGERYGITIESIKNKGTRIEILLPKQYV